MTTTTNTNDTTKLAGLLASWLQVDAEDLAERRFNHYGLTVFECGRESYAIGTDGECDAAVTSYVENSVWAFRASFILECCDLPGELGQAIDSFQKDECESANDALLALVQKCCGISNFAQQAVSADGRGHFLASYDGDEIDLGNGVFAYRID